MCPKTGRARGVGGRWGFLPRELLRMARRKKMVMNQIRKRRMYSCEPTMVEQQEKYMRVAKTGVSCCFLYRVQMQSCSIKIILQQESKGTTIYELFHWMRTLKFDDQLLPFAVFELYSLDSITTNIQAWSDSTNLNWWSQYYVCLLWEDACIFLLPFLLFSNGPHIMTSSSSQPSLITVLVSLNFHQLRNREWTKYVNYGVRHRLMLSILIFKRFPDVNRDST